MGLPGAIPEEELPPCWSDEVRMNALFAPFRLKAANPESWAMKMKFWSDMLRLWCRCRGDPVLSAADAKVAFYRKGRTPACIDIVVEEMYRNGELVPLTKYQQILANGREGWVRWGARLAFKPAAIALTAVSLLLPARHAVDSDGLPKASIDSTQKFVLESVLKEQASALLDKYPPGMERVGTVDDIMSRCNWTASRDSFEMALGWLVETGRALIKDDVVKLAEPNQKVTPVSETESALVRLATAETRLERDLARLSRDQGAAAADAKAALALANRLAAKNHLRRKHKISDRLDRCTAALDNVKQLLIQLRDVAQNKAIVDTYKMTADAMKRDLKENNMSEEAVHDTMDDLKEVMDSYNEIGKAIGATVDEDTLDLEAELKELMSAETTPGKPSRKISEREFIFDGEERILAELNELGIEDASPPRPVKPPVKQPVKPPVKQPVREPVKEAVEETVAEKWTEEPRKESRPSQPWYPRADEWNNNYAEIRQDERLHPGQTLNIDYSSPARLYKHEFQVRDHKMDGGVWLFNKDSNSNVDQLVGTEYYSGESPGKSGSNFQMAPGGERKRDGSETVAENLPSLAKNQPSVAENQPSVAKNQPSTSAENYEELERRLKNLRGFNL